MKYGRRHRPKNYRRRNNRRYKSNSILRKNIAICILIVVLIIIIKSINVPLVDEVFVRVKNIVYNDNSIGTDFISNILDKDDYKEVSNSIEDNSFNSPVVNGVIIGYFGEKTNEQTNTTFFERGINIVGENNVVLCVADGTVDLIGRNTTWDKFIKIKHSDNLYTIYANLSEIVVKKGEVVERGRLIGSTNTGEQQFLHFEVWEDNELVNPLNYLNVE